MEIRKIALSCVYPNAHLTAYLPYSKDTSAPALLICPGGAYFRVCDGHEGENIAIAFASRGFRTFVLNYSVKEEARFPTPLVEASLAMAHIKRNAKEYGIDPERVFVMGFSAGGHLAGSLGTLWHKDYARENTDIAYGENRPAGMVLCYPVLAYFPESNMGTFLRVFGTETPSEEQVNEFSLERQVDAEHTVPAFLWHTMDDKAVHVENTLRMLTALRKNNVTAEAHLFPHGIHGLATADKAIAGEDTSLIDAHVAEWVDMAKNFMESLA